jgi:exodeoxyribonuclease-3
VQSVKIATWNVNSLNVRLPHVTEWLERETPDVLAVQETKMEDHKFPAEVFASLGYRSVFSGQKTYNGVAVISRQEPLDPVMEIPGFDDPQRRVMAVTLGDVRVVNLYIPNGSEVDSDKYRYKLAWLEALIGWLERERERYPRTIVLGDFNIAPEDIDVMTLPSGKARFFAVLQRERPLSGCWILAFMTPFGNSNSLRKASVGGTTV